MAMSYTQRKNAVVKSLRRVRNLYRQADSQGEVLERELDRLIDRKTLISPESLSNMVAGYRNYATKTGLINQAIADAITIASV